jgi:hypothetical protein
MESLAAEVAPFGIHTTIVNPGFFRTELLTNESTTYAESSIDDYADRRAQQLEWWNAQNGKQGGDPAKLGRALVIIASEKQPPRRFVAGADAIGLAEQKVAALRADIESNRALSISLAVAELQPLGGRAVDRKAVRSSFAASGTLSTKLKGPVRKASHRR